MKNLHLKSLSKKMKITMISKKRYWGLALPIYKCTCGHIDVLGSKDELMTRSIEGWDKFDGHSPHKPWIDEIKRVLQGVSPESELPQIWNLGAATTYLSI